MKNLRTIFGLLLLAASMQAKALTYKETVAILEKSGAFTTVMQGNVWTNGVYYTGSECMNAAFVRDDANETLKYYSKIFAAENQKCNYEQKGTTPSLSRANCVVDSDTTSRIINRAALNLNVNTPGLRVVDFKKKEAGGGGCAAAPAQMRALKDVTFDANKKILYFDIGHLGYSINIK